MQGEDQMSRALGAVAVIVTTLVLAPAGCQKEERAYPPRERTSGKATLPATPDLDPKPSLKKHPDGAWTVYGIVHADAKEREGELSVRGYVAALHTCPDLSKGCKPAPYLQLTDAADHQGRRLLVGGPIDPTRDGLKMGALATMQGRYATSSPNGLYFAPQGMLLFAPPQPDADDNADAAAASSPAR